MFRSAPLAWAALLACTTCASGCAYPRRTTPLSSLSRDAVTPQDTPSNIWRFVLVSAEVPSHQRSGLSWDDENGAPDPYLKLIIGGREIWETEAITDSANPKFEAAPPKNLSFDRTDRVRFELWDDDGMSADPIGIYEGKALADAILGAETIVKLEGGATLTVRVERPEPHAGTGIALYEVRKNALLVLKVVPHSPASRAGLKPGDRITAVNGSLIDELGVHEAESALALAAQSQSELTVETKGQYRRVKLDRGYVWLTM